jgi:hypothetical protein
MTSVIPIDPANAKVTSLKEKKKITWGKQQHQHFRLQRKSFILNSIMIIIIKPLPAILHNLSNTDY